MGVPAGVVFPGICPTCDECQTQFGLSEEEIKTMLEDGTLVDEGGFSYHNCDICHSSLGGDRYCAHEIAENGELIHLDICCDCLMELA